MQFKFNNLYIFLFTTFYNESRLTAPSRDPPLNPFYIISGTELRIESERLKTSRSVLKTSQLQETGEAER